MATSLSSVENGNTPKKTEQDKKQPVTQEDKPSDGLVGSAVESKTLFKSPWYRPSYLYPRNPDPLVEGNSYRIYEEMRQDETIKAALNMKKDFAVGTGWSIESEDEKVKEFLTDSLSRINETMPMDTSFDDILRDILSSYDYGFSLSEPVYELRDFPEGKLYWYKTIRTRPPHAFYIYVDEVGNIEKIGQMTEKGEIPFDPKIFLHHVYQQEFGNPFGQSDLFSAHPSWQAKKYVSRFMNMYLERFASPITVGKYRNGMTPTEIQRFHNLLTSLQENTTLTVPESTVVDIIQTARDASDAYLKALDYFNLQISRSVLVPDLLGIGGAQTSGGSFSLGQKHFQMFMATIEKDRKSLARKFTLKVIMPLVKANFGNEAKAEFKFNPFSDDNLIEYLKVWIQAVNGGKFKPNPEEINYFRRSTGFPEGPVVEPQPMQLDENGKPVPPKNGMNDGKMPKPDEEKEGEEGDEGEEKDDKEGDVKEQKGKVVPEDGKEKMPEEKKKEFEQSGIIIFRQLTSYETKVDFIVVKKILDMGEKDVTPKLERAGNEIINDFISQVKDKGIVKRGAIQTLAEIQPKFLKPMNSVFRLYFRDLFKESVSQARRELFRDHAVKFAAEDFLPEELLDILDQESFKAVGDYSTLVTKKARDLYVQGIKDGLSEQEITRLVRAAAVEASENWIATVVRTKTTEIMNDARKAFWENDPVADKLIEAYQFSAIMDQRTTEVCQSLDGHIYERGDFIDRLTPPLHFNCRSLLVPVTRYENYESDPDYVEPGSEPSFESLRSMGGNLILG